LNIVSTGANISHSSRMHIYNTAESLTKG